MIAEIGLMIGAYIFTRMLALILKPPEQFASKFARGLVAVFAIITVIITVIVCSDLATRGSSVANELSIP